jgi:3'-phosphoadenosine 5'-phosphosulfate sulfotransferase (PAPS reductase)/FAD synthetase
VRVKPERSFDWWVEVTDFPTGAYRWCTNYLKIAPFKDFLNGCDPKKKRIIVLGKRRAESAARSSTRKYEESKKHPGRKIFNPLYKHTDAERDELIKRAGFKVLPHRSLECCPCVNANRKDLLMVPQERIDAIRELEQATGKFMFRPAKFMGAEGIDEIIKWANSERGKYKKPEARE